MQDTQYIGFTYEEVKNELENKGIDIVEVELTLSPRSIDSEIKPWCRVVKIEHLNEASVKLILVKPFR